MADTPRAMSAADIAEWRNGWRVALGAGIGMGTGVSLYLYVASIFIGPISEEFGWSRGAISFGSMMSFLTGAVTLPILGRYLDRLGFRRVAIFCCFGLASVYALNALQTGVYEIYIAMMIAGGVFGGGTSSIIYTRPVIASFARQRGLALGIATAGTSIAAMIAPPLLMYVITEYGWRPGFFALAALTALIGLPLALALIGKAKEATAHASDDVDDAPVNVPDVTLREAVKRGRFWLLVLAIACINIPGSGVLGQLAPLVSDTGLNDGDVAIVMSIYAAGLLVGRLITGFSLDRFPPQWVGAITTLVPAIGIVLLMIPEPSFALAALAVALIGAQQGAEVDLFAYFISRSFGLKHYGSIFGVIAMAGAISTAIALVSFGKIHDATGSYDLGLQVGAVLFCVGALAFALIGREAAAGSVVVTA
ncbi:MAG: MFS transporter [Caulobacteraceae bacterium]|nr:MFS transporter [Caulobacteraceae bacterium]